MSSNEAVEAQFEKLVASMRSAIDVGIAREGLIDGAVIAGGAMLRGQTAGMTTADVDAFMELVYRMVCVAAYEVAIGRIVAERTEQP